MKTYRLILFVIAIATPLTACSGRIGTGIAQQCSDTLALAEKELDQAKAEGFGGAVSITKAAGLIVGAATQKQFERYEGCIDKAERARAYIADAQRTNK